MPMEMLRVLTKIFVGGFYRRHVGMLLVALYILFGVVEPSQIISYHHALMMAFIGSPLLMAGVFGAWLVYSLKSWYDVLGELAVPHNRFIYYSINACSAASLLVRWSMVQSLILAPMLIYGLVSIGLAIANGLWWPAVAIGSFLVVLIGAGAWLYTRKVSRPNDRQSTGFISSWMKNWPKPFYSFFLHYLFSDRKLAWVITKILSYLVIQGAFVWFADSGADLRVPSLAVIGVSVAHAMLVFERQRFDRVFLVFSRNLPVARWRLFARSATLYLLLLAPETAWLVYRYSIFDAAGLILLCVSASLLFDSIVLVTGIDTEKYLKVVFLAFVSLFWIVMFHNLWWPAISCLAISFVIFYYRHYTVE
jgi:hypothetical protein